MDTHSLLILCRLVHCAKNRVEWSIARCPSQQTKKGNHVSPHFRNWLHLNELVCWVIYPQEEESTVLVCKNKTLHQNLSVESLKHSGPTPISFCAPQVSYFLLTLFPASLPVPKIHPLLAQMFLPPNWILCPVLRVQSAHSFHQSPYPSVPPSPLPVKISYLIN